VQTTQLGCCRRETSYRQAAEEESEERDKGMNLRGKLRCLLCTASAFAFYFVTVLPPWKVSAVIERQESGTGETEQNVSVGVAVIETAYERDWLLSIPHLGNNENKLANKLAAEVMLRRSGLGITLDMPRLLAEWVLILACFAFVWLIINEATRQGRLENKKED